MPIEYDNEGKLVEESRASELRRVRYEDEIRMEKEDEEQPYLPYEQEEDSPGGNGGRKENRIPIVTAILIVSVAVLYDLVQVGLDYILVGWAVNWVIDIWAWLTFYLWFKLRGVTFGGNKLAILIVVPLIEVIAGMLELNTLSWGWTFEAVAIILVVKGEDTLKKITPSAEKIGKAKALYNTGRFVSKIAKYV